MCARQLLAPLALVCLLAAAGTAHAGRVLLEPFNPALRQFVQITVSLRGTCSAVLAANPTLLNDVRLAAIADVRRELTANPIGIANLTATLASVRAGTPNCTAVTVRCRQLRMPAHNALTMRMRWCAAAVPPPLHCTEEAAAALPPRSLSCRTPCLAP